MVDANVLLYASDRESAHHESSVQWLDAALSGLEPVYFPWLSLLAFIRLSTSRSAVMAPISAEDAFDQVDSWLSAPPSVVPTPDALHSRRMRALIAATGTGGNLTNDAYLGALSIQYDTPVISFDIDFQRFVGVDWHKPEA